jgi:mannose-1-phosphate guanylyltransferase/mannose-6-phosphate isomerase
MYPKQLLPLVSDRTMLQETVARLDGLPGLADDCIVVCSEAHRFLVAEQLAGASPEPRILLEPSGRNTAPAIALAALYALSQSHEPPVLLVLSADHVIRDATAFHAAAGAAREAAVAGALVTFGIVPSSPHTGYGYIEADADGANPVDIRSFVEKPDADTARAYLKGGRHLWNSGMFMFRADRYLEELEEHAPDILAACRAAMVEAATDPDFVRPGADEFLGCRADSIDYAVME